MGADEFIASKEFILFQDERLRLHACEAVAYFLKNSEAVDKSQLYAIPSAIHASGLAGLKKLSDNQKQKNSRVKNKAFWGFVSDLLFKIPEPEYSLRRCIRNELEHKHLLASEEGADSKKEIRIIRKGNKARIDQIMNQTLPIYFEHFNCHYFYQTG